jgi:prefoldin beta subunit
VPELPKQLQDKLSRYQQMTQQLQIVSAQLQQVQQQSVETKATLEELGKLEGESVVYRSTGALLIRVKDLEALRKELGDRKEELEVKEKSYSRHEQSLRKTVEELKDELNAAISRGVAGGGKGGSGGGGGTRISDDDEEVA